MAGGRAEVAASLVAPVEVSELVHLFAQPIKEHRALAVLLYHSHDTALQSIEIPLKWLGIPASSDWSAHLLNKQYQIWEDVKGVLRGSDSLTTGRAEPYEAVVYLLTPLGSNNSPTPSLALLAEASKTAETKR